MAPIRPIWWFESERRWWMERANHLTNARVLSVVPDAIHVTNALDVLDPKFVEYLTRESESEHGN